MGIYQTAIMDYMHIPEIVNVELVNCLEDATWMILIEAYDMFRVSGVAVSIVALDSKIMEDGEAKIEYCDLS